jgi:hypothetical protein
MKSERNRKERRGHASPSSSGLLHQGQPLFEATAGCSGDPRASTPTISYSTDIVRNSVPICACGLMNDRVIGPCVY